jgi:hypothetical protein
MVDQLKALGFPEELLLELGRPKKRGPKSKKKGKHSATSHLRSSGDRFQVTVHWVATVISSKSKQHPPSSLCFILKCIERIEPKKIIGKAF